MLAAQWTHRLPIIQHQSPAQLAAELILEVPLFQDSSDDDIAIVDFCSGGGGKKSLFPANILFSPPYSRFFSSCLLQEQYMFIFLLRFHTSPAHHEPHPKSLPNAWFIHDINHHLQLTQHCKSNNALQSTFSSRLLQRL
jgi:hypothetical protein